MWWGTKPGVAGVGGSRGGSGAGGSRGFWSWGFVLVLVVMGFEGVFSRWKQRRVSA